MVLLGLNFLRKIRKTKYYFFLKLIIDGGCSATQLDTCPPAAYIGSLDLRRVAALWLASWLIGHIAAMGN